MPKQRQLQNLQDLFARLPEEVQERARRQQAGPPPLPEDFSERARSTTDPREWGQLKALIQRHPRDVKYGWGHEALYSNPLAGQFDSTTAGPRRGLFGRIKQATQNVAGPLSSRRGRTAIGRTAALALAGTALGGGFSGAGAGAGSEAAGWIDPFVAGGGLGAAAPAAATSSTAAGWIDPFLEGGGLSAAKAAGPAAAAAGGGWKEYAIKTGIGLLADRLLNKQTGAEKTALRQSTAPYESWDIQRFLPPELRQAATGPMLQSGMEGIAELLRNPGGLSPTVSDAIRARLGQESQSIGQNFRGIASQQAGAVARGNVPLSMKGALQSALDVAQERAQRGARQTALTESDQLRRQDLSQVYALLDAIMQMISARQGQAVTGLGAASQSAQQRQAATMALIGSLLQPRTD